MINIYSSINKNISSNLPPEDLMTIGKILLVIFAVLLILAIINTASRFVLFRKAGEAGWKAIMPVYNKYVMIQLGLGVNYEWLMAGLLATYVSASISGPLGQLLTLIGVVATVVIEYGFIRRFTNTGVTIASMVIPFIILPYLAISRKVTYDTKLEYKDIDLNLFDNSRKE